MNIHIFKKNLMQKISFLYKANIIIISIYAQAQAADIKATDIQAILFDRPCSPSPLATNQNFIQSAAQQADAKAHTAKVTADKLAKEADERKSEINLIAKALQVQQKAREKKAILLERITRTTAIFEPKESPRVSAFRELASAFKNAAAKDVEKFASSQKSPVLLAAQDLADQAELASKNAEIEASIALQEARLARKTTNDS